MVLFLQVILILIGASMIVSAENGKPKFTAGNWDELPLWLLARD